MKFKLVVLTFFVGLNAHFIFGQDPSVRQLNVDGVNALMDGDYSKSLELLTKAKKKAEDEGDFENLFLAINNIGLNYHKLLDTNEALEYYLEAYTIALKELDPSFEMTSLNNIAILYSEEKNLDKAIEYLLKAYGLAEKEKDDLRNGIYAINLAQAYSDKREYKEAVPYINDALRLLENEPDYLLEALALNAILQKDLGNVNRSENLINELLPKLQENRYAEARVSVMLALASIKEQYGQIDDALRICNNALKQEPINFETRYDIFEKINEINRKAENYQGALVVMDSMTHLKEAIHNLRSNQQYQANKVKFEVLNYETQMAEDQQRIQSQTRLIIVLTIGAVLIIVLLAWSLRLSRIRNKQRRILLERQEEILNLELENEKANNLLLEEQLKEKETKLLLEQEQHKNEIESKNRKLSAKALYLIDRNRLVESIIEDLEQSEKIKPSREISNYIRRLKSLLKSEEEWENFVQYFDEVNHGLLSRLKDKHDNLNANDIRFISYLYMNLSMKEIASIMNITPEACRKRKERISKKIDLDDNVELYSYLSQI